MVPTITLTVIDSTSADEYYSREDITRFGYKHAEDFSKDAVFVSFRVSFPDQSFPLRVWFKKSEVSENDWLGHARKKAADMITWTHEVTQHWTAA
jgi:hypothetical protein